MRLKEKGFSDTTVGSVAETVLKENDIVGLNKVKSKPSQWSFPSLLRCITDNEIS